MAALPSVAVYWAAGCGGCEIAFVNVHQTLLEVADRFTLVFCPALLDFKRADLEAAPDGSIDATLFNGALRTEENVEMARLLRAKSKLLLACGACASGGGVPALANLAGIDPLSAYPQGRPQTRVEVPEGVLELPALLPRVLRLAEVVAVDASIPGCPPESSALAGLLGALIGAESLPAGAIVGGGHSAVCDQCARERRGTPVAALTRTVFADSLDPTWCLLEQGVLCQGPATRDGCGALCPSVQIPCGGCYGPCEGASDSGAKLAGTLGGLLDLEALKGLPEAELRRRIGASLDAVPDWAGVLYKFGLAGSLLAAAKRGAK